MGAMQPQRLELSDRTGSSLKDVTHRAGVFGEKCVRIFQFMFLLYLYTF